MSRTGGIRPEYRLRFGYPYVTIERVGAPPRRVRIDADDPREPLRGFAAEIERVGGRLKAVLPPSEVWRGTVAAQDATEAALRAGAQALGAELAEIEVALGPDGADGRRPAAAARRETIAEAQAFLERAGFGSVETTATPSLPGFHERAAASAPPRSVRRPVALAASGLAATLALSLWLGPWRLEAPEPKAEASPATVATVAAPAAPPLAEAPSTSARPAPSPTLTSVALAPSPPSPAAAADPAPRMAPVALAGRNMPVDLRPPSAPEAAAAASAYLAPRPRPAAPATEPETAVAEAGGPRPRAAAAAVTPLAPLDAAILDGRPRARPVAAEAVTASLDPALAAESVPPPPGGPLARPASPAASTPPVAIEAPRLVAAPNPSPAAMAALAAEAVRNAASEPRRIAARAQPAAPSPAFVRPQAEAPQVRTVRAQPPEAQIQRRPRREPVAVVQTMRAAVVQPARVSAASVVRTRAAAPTGVERPLREASFGRPSRPGRDDLALIGIFGGAEGRHALVQLPNGETERVRPGDELRGIQVTAVGADAVHLRARGRDTVLKLPN